MIRKDQKVKLLELLVSLSLFHSRDINRLYRSKHGSSIDIQDISEYLAGLNNQGLLKIHSRSSDGLVIYDWSTN